MKLNCLVVDDEPLSQDILADFVRTCPELNLLAVCNDALDTGEKLMQEKVDLLFLDINMPKLSGISFVKSLKEPPLFIFVTAYPQYAVESFEVDAVDYLLKPVSFERFRAAVNRVVDRLSGRENGPKHMMLRADKKDYRVDLDDILFLEAQGDYVRFVTKNQTLTVHGKLKDFIDELPAKAFARIHKSFVIALDKVEYLEGRQVKIDKYKLPVSLNFAENLAKGLKT